MWREGWRDEAWQRLGEPWDLIVIGGGITGAGILREASQMGLRALLVEARDFAWGTSSRSSKQVHGGLRYLKNAQVRMTFESVRERERLLRDGRGLVSPLGFLYATYADDSLKPWMFSAALAIYDLLALRWGHRQYPPDELRALCPPLRAERLLAGFRYLDARVDDARLVLRLIHEGVQGGGLALNYTPVVELLRRQNGAVCGVALRDAAGSPGAGRSVEVQAPVVINATGVWADEVRQRLGAGVVRHGRELRKLRGSHLIFPWARVPLQRAVGLTHPADGRVVFALPWEGVTLVGTTDVDHAGELDDEPAISAGEAEYLLAGARYAFPGLGLTQHDIQGTFAGVRPVVNTGRADPSAESRESVLWNERGLLTVTGGKLTTFRLMAHAALRAAARQMAGRHVTRRTARDAVLDAPPDAVDLAATLPRPALRRLTGRYGAHVAPLVADARPGELTPIDPGLPSLWAELRFAARCEAVVHLDDLLLRRLRLGLILPEGALPHLPAIRAIVQPVLGWSDERWEQEASRYRQIRSRCYALPH